MIIDIHEGETEKTIVLVSDDPRFVREFGKNRLECSTKGIYQNLRMIVAWTDNTLREKCYFEVE